MLTFARRVTCLGASAWLSNELFIRSPAALADAHTNTHCTYISQAASSPQNALQEGTHFAVLSGADGSPSRLGVVAAAAMLRSDVVLLGEFHDDAVAHALKFALLKHVATRLGHTKSPSQQPQQTQQPQQQAGQAHHPPQAPAPAAAESAQQQLPSRPLILSLEMFETDVQTTLDEYLADLIPASDLLKDARPWSNYEHDYQLLVQFCKAHKLPVVAANAPRRYVSLAGRQGSEALLRLLDASKQWLPPLPHAPSSEAYVAKVQRNMAQAAASMQALEQQQQQHKQPEGPSSTAADGKGCPYIGLTVSSNFLAAQSLWDATMAYAIAGALQKHQPPTPQPPRQQQQQATLQPSTTTAALAQPQADNKTDAAASSDNTSASSSSSSAPSSDAHLPTGPLVVHVCGKFHCEDRLGIPEHLATYAPDAKVLVVVFQPHDMSTAVSAEEAKAAGLVGAADFVVLTDSRLPRSFVVEHPV